MHDTFYLSNSGLLRTHTSPVQIRTMEKVNLRTESYVLVRFTEKIRSHSYSYVPSNRRAGGRKDASFAQLKGLLNDFLEDFFGEKLN